MFDLLKQFFGGKPTPDQPEPVPQREILPDDDQPHVPSRLEREFGLQAPEGVTPLPQPAPPSPAPVESVPAPQAPAPVESVPAPQTPAPSEPEPMPQASELPPPELEQERSPSLPGWATKPTEAGDKWEQPDLPPQQLPNQGAPPEPAILSEPPPSKEPAWIAKYRADPAMAASPLPRDWKHDSDQPQQKAPELPPPAPVAEAALPGTITPTDDGGETWTRYERPSPPESEPTAQTPTAIPGELPAETGPSNRIQPADAGDDEQQPRSEYQPTREIEPGQGVKVPPEMAGNPEGEATAAKFRALMATPSDQTPNSGSSSEGITREQGDQIISLLTQIAGRDGESEKEEPPWDRMIEALESAGGVV